MIILSDSESLSEKTTTAFDKEVMIDDGDKMDVPDETNKR